MSAPTLKPVAASPHGFDRHAAPLIPSKFLPLAMARIVAALARAHRIRRDTRQLMGFSDHLLSDIGVGRSEIGSVVRLGRDASHQRRP